MSLMGILDRVADAAALDKVIDPARRAVQAALPQPVKNLLHGTWLGHPVHPVLVHVPVGAWVSAGLLDLVPPFRPAATALIGTGVAAAVPASLSGAADWSEQDAGVRRLGALHAVLNTAALGLYVGSLAARKRGRGALGLALSYAGLGVATGSAAIGGHMSYAQSSGVSHATTAARALTHGLDRPGAARRPARGPARAADGQGERRRRPAGRRPPGCPGRRVRRRLLAPVRAAARGHGGGRARLRLPGLPVARLGVRPGQRRRRAGGRPPTPQEKLEVRMEAGRVMARLRPERHR